MTNTNVLSLEAAKAHLNITVDKNDDELQATINEAVDLAQRTFGIFLDEQQVTETYDGGSYAIMLRQGPVTSVDTVSEGPNPVTQFILKPSGVLLWGTPLSGRPWLPGREYVSVTYTCGYGTDDDGNWLGPLTAVRGIKILVKYLWKSQTGPGAFGQTADDGSTAPSGLGFAMPAAVEECFNPLRSVGFA